MGYTNTIITQTEVTVTNQDIDDIVGTALDSGISYWAYKAEVVGKYRGEFASDQISRDGELVIYLDEPFDDDDTEAYTLDKASFLRGLRMYIEDPQKPYNIVEFDEKTGKNVIDTGMVDAVVADMIIQYALFNEVVFG